MACSFAIREESSLLLAKTSTQSTFQEARKGKPNKFLSAEKSQSFNRTQSTEAIKTDTKLQKERALGEANI